MYAITYDCFISRIIISTNYAGMQGNAISVKFVKIINFLIKRSRVEISRASYELI